MGSSIENLYTEPMDPGPNPTINKTMRFFVNLPVEEIYCPRLSCQVFDTIYAGFNQPIIGSFFIELASRIEKQREKRKKKL